MDMRLQLNNSICSHPIWPYSLWGQKNIFATERKGCVTFPARRQKTTRAESKT